MSRPPRSWSNKDPDEIARMREARLRATLAKALLKDGRVEEAVKYLTDAINSPILKGRTKVQAARSLLTAAGRATSRPDINIMQSQGMLTAADLLNLADTAEAPAQIKASVAPSLPSDQQTPAGPAFNNKRPPDAPETADDPTEEPKPDA